MLWLGCCSRMTNGIASRICSENPPTQGVRRSIVGKSSTESCGFCGPVRRGEICRRNSGSGRLRGDCSTNGTPTARWKRLSSTCVRRRSRSAPSAKNSGASMAPWSAPPAARQGAEKRDPEEPADHALGRSRGGVSTKIHLLCDGHGHPLHFHLTAGQDHESTALKPLLQGADERRVTTDGEPIAWPLQLAGDKGYRADWIDEYLLALDIQPVIPSKSNEDRNDRPIEFDRDAYRQRNIVERRWAGSKRAAVSSHASTRRRRISAE